MKKYFALVLLVIGFLVSCQNPDTIIERTFTATIVGIAYDQKFVSWDGTYLILNRGYWDTGIWENGKKYQTWFVLSPIPQELSEKLTLPASFTMRYVWVQRTHRIPVIRILGLKKE